MRDNADWPETLYPSAFQSKSGVFQGAALLGFEPRQNDSESFVLPLHHKAKWVANPKDMGFFVNQFLANRPKFRSDSPQITT